MLLSEKLRNPSRTWCLSSGKSTCMRISSAYFLSLKLSSFMPDKALLKLLSSLPTLSSFLARSGRATPRAESRAPASTHRPRPQRYRLPRALRPQTLFKAVLSATPPPLPARLARMFWALNVFICSNRAHLFQKGAPQQPAYP